MNNAENAVREEMVAIARSLYQRGYTHGTTGNLSVRLGAQVLITPTGSSFGFVKPEELALANLTNGEAIGTSKPSKELPFHLAAYHVRADVQAVVHLHSTHSVALSCLEELDPANMLPPITPYLVMEYVEGQPLDQYCDNQNLSTLARLKGLCGGAVCTPTTHHSPRSEARQYVGHSGRSREVIGLWHSQTIDG